MIAKEFAEVMEQYQATWPKTKLNPKTVEAWYPAMAEFTQIHAYQALERLAGEQDLMPMLSQFRRMAAQVRLELDDAEGKPRQEYDPAEYPDTAYLKAAKPLIYGEASSYLLMTPVRELDAEGAGLKVKVLDCATRHRALMESGHRPDTNMLVEVTNLASAVDEWWAPRKEELQQKKQRDAAAAQERKETRPEPRAATTRRKRA